MKKITLFLVLFITVSLLVGCTNEKTDSLAKGYIVKESIHKASKHLSLKEKKKVIFVAHTFKNEHVYLRGYEREYPEKKIEMALDYNDDFRIVQ